jgi:membrane associated rhomboid family serine protease
MFLHYDTGHFRNMAWDLVRFLPLLTLVFDGDQFHSVAFFVTSGIIGGYVLRLASLSRYADPFTCIAGASNAMFATMAAYAVAYPREKMWVVVPGLVHVDMATYIGFWVALDIWGTIFLVRFADWGNAVSWAQPRDVDIY